jgi:hypothetical protein
MNKVYRTFSKRMGMPMIGHIVVELEAPGDSRSMFRLLMDSTVVAEGLTAAQAHILVGEVLDRITLPRRGVEAAKRPGLGGEVDPVVRTTGAGILIGSSAVPFSSDS